MTSDPSARSCDGWQQDLALRRPVDRVAARVVAKGIHFEPSKDAQTNDSATPLRIRPIDVSMTKNPGSFEDLTGRRFGRFVVLGLAADVPKQWAVRCTCGMYSTRWKKAITNPRNGDDCCGQCQHLEYIRRGDWRRIKERQWELPHKRRVAARIASGLTLEEWKARARVTIQRETKS